MLSAQIKKDYQNNNLSSLADDLEAEANEPARIGEVQTDVSSGTMMEITNTLECIADLIYDGDADSADLADYNYLLALHRSGVRYVVLQYKNRKNEYHKANRKDYLEALKAIAKNKTMDKE